MDVNNNLNIGEAATEGDLKAWRAIMIFSIHKKANYDLLTTPVSLIPEI